MMKTSLRIIALILAGAAVAYWLAEGGNRGWSKNSVPIKVKDEVTGIEGVYWENHYVPGVDFLGAALVGAGALAGISFLLARKNKSPLMSEQKEAN